MTLPPASTETQIASVSQLLDDLDALRKASEALGEAQRTSSALIDTASAVARSSEALAARVETTSEAATAAIDQAMRTSAASARDTTREATHRLDAAAAAQAEAVAAAVEVQAALAVLVESLSGSSVVVHVSEVAARHEADASTRADALREHVSAEASQIGEAMNAGHGRLEAAVVEGIQKLLNERVQQVLSSLHHLDTRATQTSASLAESLDTVQQSLTPSGRVSLYALAVSVSSAVGALNSQTTELRGETHTAHAALAKALRTTEEGVHQLANQHASLAQPLLSIQKGLEELAKRQYQVHATLDSMHLPKRLDHLTARLNATQTEMQAAVKEASDSAQAARRMALWSVALGILVLVLAAALSAGLLPLR